MAIQTQRFTPLRHNRYKLAETASEKDAELDRKMALQQQRINASAQEANIRALNTANLANQRIAENKKLADVASEKEDYRRGQIDIERGREDERIEGVQEKEDYRREQTNLDRLRAEALDKKNSELALKQQERQDYVFNRKKEEDARVDSLRRGKETFKNKTLALGALGLVLSDSITANKYIEGTNKIDLSEEIDSLKILTPKHSWENTPSGVISEDGATLTLMDGDNVVMASNNKSPVAVKVSSIQQAKKYAESEFERILGVQSNQGNSTAIKEAFSKFKTFEKMSVDANKLLNDMQFEGDASPGELNRQANKVEEYSNKAALYYNMSEGGYNLDDKYNLLSRPDYQNNNKADNKKESVINKLIKERGSSNNLLVEEKTKGIKKPISKEKPSQSLKEHAKEKWLEEAQVYYPAHNLSNLSMDQLKIAVKEAKKKNNIR